MQRGPRRQRRPSVERAIEEYSDGASSDSDREGEDKGGGGAPSAGEDEEQRGRRGKGKGKGARNLTRRTSARRQRQDEMREANVAAERENDMQVLVLTPSIISVISGRAKSSKRSSIKCEVSIAPYAPLAPVCPDNAYTRASPDRSKREKLVRMLAREML